MCNEDQLNHYILSVFKFKFLLILNVLHRDTEEIEIDHISDSLINDWLLILIVSSKILIN